MKSKIGIIISREVRERVRKKSFIITTILMPILMIALCALPTVIMLHGGSDIRHIVVIDETEGQYVSNSLHSNSTVEFELLENISRKEASLEYDNDDKAFGILWIGHDILDNHDQIQLITNSSSSIMIDEEIADQVSEALKTAKLRSYDIDNLEQIIEESDIRISLNTMKNNGSGDEKSMEQTSSSVSMAISMVFGGLLYCFILLYGQQVLTTVIEEKQSRVLDVMVTSCPPFDLMMGKILGIAAVAAIQVVIWGVLITAASQFLMPAISAEAIQGASTEMAAMSATIGDVRYILTIFVWLLLYIVGGFLLYAALYAAAGSSVDSVQDAQQFNTIILVPIMVSIMVMMSVMNDPNSSLVFWCSIIPFTSPVVMMARIPFDVPTWEILVSLVTLYVSFVLLTWIAARIYRIGIFMHGSKPTWKELCSWIRMK